MIAIIIMCHVYFPQFSKHPWQLLTIIITQIKYYD